MRNFRLVLQAINETPWALLPSKLEEIRAFLETISGGNVPSLEEAVKEYKARVVGPNDVAIPQQIGSTAVIPVFGTVGHRMNLLSDFSGGTSTEQLKAQILKAAADPNVAAIMLDVNSPGGAVGGLPELHTAIMNARDTKPIVASINAQSASAAYWITSACSEVCITPSGECGSIGVFLMHQDISKMAESDGVVTTIIKAGKYKAEGNKYEPLSDEARENLQAMVDSYYEMFVANVAKGRGISSKEVNANYGQGRMMTAVNAKAAGLVDRIESQDQTLSRLAKVGGKAARTARAENMRFGLASKFFD